MQIWMEGYRKAAACGIADFKSRRGETGRRRPCREGGWPWTSRQSPKVVHLYSIAIDFPHWDLFDEIFTPDVELDYCHVLGWSDLASFKRDFAGMHDDLPGHQHFLGVPQIVIEGDRAWALTYGRFNLFRRSPATELGDMSQGGAWYDANSSARRPAGAFASASPATSGGRVRCPRKARSASGRLLPRPAGKGEIAFVNALRRQLGDAARVVEPAA
jgi:hypothetical protein